MQNINQHSANKNQHVIELNDTAAVDRYFKEQSEKFKRDKSKSSFENLDMRVQRKKLSLELESDQTQKFDPSTLLKDYQSPDPTLSKLDNYEGIYQLLYSLQKSRIDNSLVPIYEYLKDKVSRIDVTSTKLNEHAFDYAELRKKQTLLKLRGTSNEVANGEQLEGIQEIIKSMSHKKRGGDESDEDGDGEIPETAIQIQLKELISRYNIQIDRQKVQEYSQRGVIKCEAEPQAFHQYKKNSLFQKRDDFIIEDNQLERKILVQRLIVLLDKIREEQRNLQIAQGNIKSQESQKKRQKFFDKLKEIRVQNKDLSGQKTQGYSQMDPYYKEMRLKNYQKLYHQMLEKLANKRSITHIEETEEIDKILEKRKQDLKAKKQAKKQSELEKKRQSQRYAAFGSVKMNESIQDDEGMTTIDFNQSPRLIQNSSEIDLSGLLNKSPESALQLPKIQTFKHQTRKSVQGPLKATFPLLIKPPVLRKLDYSPLNVSHSKKSLMQSIVQLPNGSGEEIIKDSKFRESIKIFKDSSRKRLNQSVLVESKVLPSSKVKFLNLKTPQQKLLELPIRSSSRLQIGSVNLAPSTTNHQSQLDYKFSHIQKPESKDKQQIKSLIDQCFKAERSNPLHTLEKQHYLESLRVAKLQDSAELMRELEYSSPEKLKYFYVYKARSQEDYEQEQREIKNEYKNGITDPLRQVAKMEKRGLRGNQVGAGARKLGVNFV